MKLLITVIIIGAFLFAVLFILLAGAKRNDILFKNKFIGKKKKNDLNNSNNF